ncbi:MAG: hypothetical protein J7J43_01880, partial [Thermosipho sp. (in: Bacteria)]|nr:hypothetical protein [Thermosipho sp. (in: thermotogales)]
SLFSCVNLKSIFKPVVSITSPDDGEYFTNPYITVEGNISNFNGTEATLYLNGTPTNISVSNGNFNHNLVLEDGTNTIKVEAVSPAGVGANEITVFYDATYDPSVIIITNPTNDEIFDHPFITLEGTIVNFNGTETTLFLNGLSRKMPVYDYDGFEYYPVLDSGTNTLRVQAEIDNQLYYNEVSVFYDATPTALWIEATWYNEDGEMPGDAEVDLFVYEPDGTVVYWNNQYGNGELPQDSCEYGPETYILYTDKMISGEYVIRVHLYDVYSGATPVTCKVIAKKFGEIVINKDFVLNYYDDVNDPAEDPNYDFTQPDWYYVGTIELP